MLETHVLVFLSVSAGISIIVDFTWKISGFHRMLQRVFTCIIFEALQIIIFMIISR